MKNHSIILARGGSKGIIKKNLCLVNNETLLKRVILKAKSIFPNNKIYVSSTIENYDPSLCWDELVNYYE